MRPLLIVAIVGGAGFAVIAIAGIAAHAIGAGSDAALVVGGTGAIVGAFLRWRGASARSEAPRREQIARRWQRVGLGMAGASAVAALGEVAYSMHGPETPDAFLRDVLRGPHGVGWTVDPLMTLVAPSLLLIASLLIPVVAGVFISRRSGDLIP